MLTTVSEGELAYPSQASSSTNHGSPARCGWYTGDQEQEDRKGGGMGEGF
jgi:hypothetical protein